MRIAARRALVDGRMQDGVVLEVGADGRIAAITIGDDAVSTDATDADLRLGTVVPAFANTHSHAFHRLLRGRTHDGGGHFWRWRDEMYRWAGTLDPDRMRAVATALYDEMADAGFGSVGEFHYLHHSPDGTAYADHDMEVAIADAARSAGLGLTLLDACYLRGGPDLPLAGAQVRFSDGDADRWLARWNGLRERLAASHPDVVVGVAIHSTRAVSPADIGRVVAGIPADVPLHVHLSEQPAENAEARAETGSSPTRILDDAGALAARTTVVHATHLDPEDVALLGRRGVTVSMCPTTEGDLGDGLGEAAALRESGAVVAIGTDQHVVIDPFAELRGLEWGARMRTGTRGVFAPDALWRAGGIDGARALGRPGGAASDLTVGARADLLELDTDSVRTAGSLPDQLVLTASSTDIRTLVQSGRIRTRRGDPSVLSDLVAQIGGAS